MQGFVLDKNEAEAYVSLPDGTNICIGVSQLSPNTKCGSTVNLQGNTSKRTNHNISSLTF